MQFQGGNELVEKQTHLSSTAVEIVGTGSAMGQNVLESVQGGWLGWPGSKLAPPVKFSECFHVV